MFQFVLLLVLGLVGLWYCAEKTVSNAEVLIQQLGVSSFAFGAIFVSVSTGLPEIATALVSAYQGVPELSAGDILGSSFVNLTLVLGLTVLVSKNIELGEGELRLARAASAVTMVAALFLYVAESLSVYTSGFLAALYVVFLFSFKESYARADTGEASDLKLKVLKTLLGLAGLIISARLMVFSAVSIGEILNIPVELLGATVIAVGTGLPELAFEITSVKKGDYSLALGDIFGSTVVNITLAIGLLGAVSMPRLENLLVVLVLVILAGAAVLGLSWKGRFRRRDGVLLLVLFVLFIFLQVSSLF